MIKIEDLEYITHNIEPIWNFDSKILILGSFPSVKSRESRFFYGHPQNRFWKVTASIFDCETPQTVEQKKKFLLANGIALWDVIAFCYIKGSSDSSIKGAVPNDITDIINKSNISSVFLNGNTAARLYDKYLSPYVNIKSFVLPSTSPANAAWTLQRLIESWKIIK